MGGERGGEEERECDEEVVPVEPSDALPAEVETGAETEDTDGREDPSGGLFGGVGIFS